MLKIYFTRKNENYIILNTLLKNNIYTYIYVPIWSTKWKNPNWFTSMTEARWQPTSIGFLFSFFNCRLVWNEKQVCEQFTENMIVFHDLFEWDILILNPCWINTSHIQFHRDAQLLATTRMVKKVWWILDSTKHKSCNDKYT